MILVQKPIGATANVELNIPQLTLAKLAQFGRHQSEPQEITSLIFTDGNFFLNLFCSSLLKQYKGQKKTRLYEQS